MHEVVDARGEEVDELQAAARRGEVSGCVRWEDVDGVVSGG